MAKARLIPREATDGVAVPVPDQAPDGAVAEAMAMPVVEAKAAVAEPVPAVRMTRPEADDVAVANAGEEPGPRPAVVETMAAPMAVLMVDFLMNAAVNEDLDGAGVMGRGGGGSNAGEGDRTEGDNGSKGDLSQHGDLLSFLPADRPRPGFAVWDARMVANPT